MEKIPEERRRDLSDIAGTRREDPAFDAALEEQHRIDAAEVEDILRSVDTLPTVDDRSTDEILGYNENGVPR